jgi:hypothetical protein
MHRDNLLIDEIVTYHIIGFFFVGGWVNILIMLTLLERALATSSNCESPRGVLLL